MSGTLAGRVIVVTRPAGLAGPLADRVRSRGGETIDFPAIEIAPPSDPAVLESLIERLDRFDIAVFISPSAVRAGLAAVRARRAWPQAIRVAAVGAGTAAALEAEGLSGTLAPEGRGDSEALAALPALAQLQGRSIVIFRGEGGRESLRAVLESRGARVEYAPCYRRAAPHADARPLIDRWRSGGVHAVSITSAEGLANLAAMLGGEGAALLRATALFVPHPRIGEACRRFGAARVIVTEPGDDALVTALERFFAGV